jgi:hypothetical protein
MINDILYLFISNWNEKLAAGQQPERREQGYTIQCTIYMPATGSCRFFLGKVFAQ